MLAGMVGACSPMYVLRAGYEEAKILWRRRPIEALLADPGLDGGLRAKLALALEARAFAADVLRLRAGGSFASYARVDEGQVVHVVTAAERFRLRSYTWWFPIVGSVPYKGFFESAAAGAEARALEAGGFDTYVRPSVAFSTLGWFDDPLLSSVVRHDRVTVVNVIVHELLHNTLYVPGQAAFNESFANFVGHRGAILFFSSRDPAAQRQAQLEWDDALRFSQFLGEFSSRLEDAYARGLSLEERDALFAAAQEEFRRLPLATDSHADFGVRPLNNAVLLAHLAYADRLAWFEDLWKRNRGDLAATVAHLVEAVRSADADAFAALQALLSG